MGLQQKAIWISSILTYLVIMGINVLIAVICLKYILPFKSSLGYLFLFFILFAMTSITLSFLTCAVFDSPRIAIQVQVLLYFIGYGIYYYYGTGGLSKVQSTCLCLFAPSCLGMGLRSVGYLEEYGIGLHMYSAGQQIFNIDFQTILGMLTLDFLLYGFIAWYLNQDWPQSFGARRPWNFLCFRSYWSKRKRNLPIETVISNFSFPFLYIIFVLGAFRERVE